MSPPHSSYPSDTAHAPCHTLCALHGAKLDEILRAIESLREDQSAQAAKLDRLHGHYFEGNGVPATVTRLAQLEQAIGGDAIPAVRLARVEQSIGGIIWLAGAAFVAAIGAIATKLFGSGP